MSHDPHRTAFVPRLESIRGIAALIVAAAHSFRAIEGEGFQAEVALWWDTLFNGNAAVTLFFVLSGYVLGESLRRAQGGFWIEYFRFGMRRLFRIYPVFLFSTLVVVSILYYHSFAGPLLPEWFGRILDYRKGVLNPTSPPSVSVTFHNILLYSATLNPVTWTLVIELRCSLLLPFVHWLSSRLKHKGRLLLLMSLTFLACLCKWCLLMGWVGLEGQLYPIFSRWFDCLFLFYLGYLLPQAGPAVFRALNQRKYAHGLVMIAGVALWVGADRWGDEFRFQQGVGGWLIVGGVLYGREIYLYRILDHPWTRFYGKISYSFYLWHDLVLISIARFVVFSLSKEFCATHSVLCSSGLLLVSLALTTIVAAPCYWLIERPFIHFSKHLIGQLSTAQTKRGVERGQTAPLTA